MEDKQFDLLMRVLLGILFALTKDNLYLKGMHDGIQADYRQSRIKWIEDPRDGQPISADNL